MRKFSLQPLLPDNTYIHAGDSYEENVYLQVYCDLRLKTGITSDAIDSLGEVFDEIKVTCPDCINYLYGRVEYYEKTMGIYKEKLERIKHYIPKPVVEQQQRLTRSQLLRSHK